MHLILRLGGQNDRHGACVLRSTTANQVLMQVPKHKAVFSSAAFEPQFFCLLINIDCCCYYCCFAVVPSVIGFSFQGTALIDLTDSIGKLACKVPPSVNLAEVMGKLTGTLAKVE